jgi:hypothetical protein
MSLTRANVVSPTTYSDPFSTAILPEFSAHMEDNGPSPNTVRACAFNLCDFTSFLRRPSLECNGCPRLQ